MVLRTFCNPGRIGWIAFLLATGGCATNQDLRDLQNEVRALAVRQDSSFHALVQSLQRLNQEGLDSAQVLSESFFQFRGEVNNRLLAIQDQQLRLSELAGQSQRNLARLRDELNAQPRWRPPQTENPGDPDSQETGEVVPQRQGTPDSGTSSPPEADYNASVQNLNRGNFTVARMGFNRFIEEYPNHELTPSAYLHLGELSSQENRLEEAVAIFLRVPELFPASEEVASALFRAGLLYLEMEDFGQARRYLERLVGSYGDHRFAALARQRLQEIP